MVRYNVRQDKRGDNLSHPSGRPFHLGRMVKHSVRWIIFLTSDNWDYVRNGFVQGRRGLTSSRFENMWSSFALSGSMSFILAAKLKALKVGLN